MALPRADGGGQGNVIGAVAEAGFMLGLERNSRAVLAGAQDGGGRHVRGCARALLQEDGCLAILPAAPCNLPACRCPPRAGAYAPLLVNTNARPWPTNMIVFDNHRWAVLHGWVARGLQRSSGVASRNVAWCRLLLLCPPRTRSEGTQACPVHHTGTRCPLAHNIAHSSTSPTNLIVLDNHRSSGMHQGVCGLPPLNADAGQPHIPSPALRLCPVLAPPRCRSFGIPSYHVQQLLSAHLGSAYLDTRVGPGADSCRIVWSVLEHTQPAAAWSLTLTACLQVEGPAAADTLAAAASCLSDACDQVTGLLGSCYVNSQPFCCPHRVKNRPA